VLFSWFKGIDIVSEIFLSFISSIDEDPVNYFFSEATAIPIPILWWAFGT